MKVRSSVFATFILICEVVGVALFLRGFFPVPVKSSLPSKSKLSDLPAEPLTGELSSRTAFPPPGSTLLFPSTGTCHKTIFYLRASLLQVALPTPLDSPSLFLNGWSSCWWMPCERTLCLDPAVACTCPTPGTWWREARPTATSPKRDLPLSPCPG